MGLIRDIASVIIVILYTIIVFATGYGFAKVQKEKEK